MKGDGPWPRSVSFGPDGLDFGPRSAADLAAEFGTPLVAVDEDHLRERCREFREAFGRVLWAVKSFPVRGLIRTVADEGLGLLVATGGELDAALRAGVPPSEITFHGNNKSDEEIRMAIASEVGVLVLDNEEEPDRVDRAAAEAGVTQPVILRLAPGVGAGAHAYVTTGAPDTKFGVPVAEGLALRTLKRALGCRNLEVRGVHVHVGSQLLDEGPYLSVLEVVLDFLAEAHSSFDYGARLLDLGGGMGIAYRGEEPAPPGRLAALIRERLGEGCRARNLPVPELVVEPGRALAGGAAITLYRVGTIKEVPGIRTYVSVDGGMSDNIRPALYEARYSLALASRRSEAGDVLFTVAGRHCESGDILARDVLLPGDLRRDDLLAFAATGAYEYAMASNYNKVGRPAVVLVKGGRARLIVRREDPWDLARLDVEPDPVDGAPVPPGVEVRAARTRDAGGVHDLVAAVAGERRFIRTEQVGGPSREFRRRFRRSWTGDGAELVAVAEGRVVGHLGIVRERGQSVAHVASLGMAVLGEWRGRGVGAALMAEAIRWARWAGVEKLTLSVFPHNRAALALYRRFGFIEEGRLRRHAKKSYGYEDEVVMARWV